MSIHPSLSLLFTWELLGFIASALVLAAFCMREMVPLRIVALFSNLAFVAYGAALDLTPIWLLHALLLPMNGWRLLQTLMAGMPAHVALRRARPGTLVRMRDLA